MKISIIHHIGLATMGLALLSLTSCSDYLDKQPSKSSNASITDASQLMGLLDGPTTFREANTAACYMSDDNGLSNGILDAYATMYQNAYYTAFYRDGIAGMTTDGLWSGEYAKIYSCNTIIENAASVTNQALAKEALANAYFVRAWSYFLLATYYCKPYTEANLSSPGLPLRLGTTFEESVQRATLGETFDLILSDLKQAEATTQDAVDPDHRWRVSKCAINGLYARIYMYMGDYDKALEYTNAALANAPELLDYNILKAGRSETYRASMGMPEQTLEYCETNNWGGQQYYFVNEFIFVRFTYNGYQWEIPSDNLTALFDQTNDLRFKWFFVEHGNRRFNCTYDTYRYSQFDDGRYVFSGISTAELLLDKAELEARKGNWQEGLKYANTLRAKRYAAGSSYELTAASQQEALKEVLEERRRELPFSLRIPDIKRFAVNSDPSDDVTITRDFYEMTQTGPTSNVQHISVAGDSPKLVLPINDMEINASHGAIEQNPEE